MIYRICQTCCVFDDGWDVLFCSHLDHCLCFDIDCLCVGFIVNLGARFQFYFCQYVLTFKDFDCLRIYERSSGIYHCFYIWKATAFCLSNPFVGITVSVEDNFLMFFQCLLDESIDSRIKVCSTGKFVCHAFQNISNSGVQYGVCTGDRHGRSHHTEFEFVSCESKW